MANPTASRNPDAEPGLERAFPLGSSDHQHKPSHYKIHNGPGFDALSDHALATDVMHHGGHRELDIHNLWGTMEARVTRQSILELRKGERPFIISRSTSAGAGKFTGHWVGDGVVGF
jgi:alpha-glucosidase (family GH31 glycosyl hydrolase)